MTKFLLSHAVDGITRDVMLQRSEPKPPIGLEPRLLTTILGYAVIGFSVTCILVCGIAGFIVRKGEDL